MDHSKSFPILKLIYLKGGPVPLDTPSKDLTFDKKSSPGLTFFLITGLAEAPSLTVEVQQQGQCLLRGKVARPDARSVTYLKLHQKLVCRGRDLLFRFPVRSLGNDGKYKLGERFQVRLSDRDQASRLKALCSPYFHTIDHDQNPNGHDISGMAESQSQSLLQSQHRPKISCQPLTQPTPTLLRTPRSTQDSAMDDLKKALLKDFVPSSLSGHNDTPITTVTSRATGTALPESPGATPRPPIESQTPATEVPAQDGPEQMDDSGPMTLGSHAESIAIALEASQNVQDLSAQVFTDLMDMQNSGIRFEATKQSTPHLDVLYPPLRSSNDPGSNEPSFLDEVVEHRPRSSGKSHVIPTQVIRSSNDTFSEAPEDLDRLFSRIVLEGGLGLLCTKVLEYLANHHYYDRPVVRSDQPHVFRQFTDVPATRPSSTPSTCMGPTPSYPQHHFGNTYYHPYPTPEPSLVYPQARPADQDPYHHLQACRHRQSDQAYESQVGRQSPVNPWAYQPHQVQHRQDHRIEFREERDVSMPTQDSQALRHPQGSVDMNEMNGDQMVMSPEDIEFEMDMAVEVD